MKPFDQYPYYPALRTRPAELDGYSELSEDAKNALLPLITIGTWANKLGWADTLPKLDATLENRPHFLDLSKEPSHVPPEMRSLLTDDNNFCNWRTFLRELPNAIPVVQLHSRSTPKIIRQALDLHNLRGKIAFRIVDPIEDTAKTAAALAALSNIEDAIVFVDRGYVQESFEAHVAAAADTINALREDFEDLIISILSTSFPSSPLRFQEPGSNGEKGRIKIMERQLHAALGGDDVCIYGDYGSIHSRVYPATGGKSNCRIDYATDSEWRFERRTNCTSDGYVECATALAATNPEIEKSPKCWGEKKIAAAARGDIEGMEVANRWIAARVNMHLARQLASVESGDGQITDDDEYEE